MSLSKSSASIAAVFALFCAQLAAQVPGAWNNVKILPPGARIRIERSGGSVLDGKLQIAGDESLVLNTSKGQEMLSLQEIKRVSVARSSHRKRNAFIGLGTGAGVGVGIGLAARSKPGQLEVISNSAIMAGSTVAGALVGVVAGIIIPTGGWREIYRQ